MEREKINWSEIIKENNIVKVRQWDDMEEEFGSYYSANKLVINCSKTFTKEMREYCGEIIKITKNMEKKFNERGYFYYEDYMFSTDMLEPYEEELDVINIPVEDEYLKDSHEEKQEKEISYLEKWSIKDNAIYAIEYNDTIEKTFLGENNIITFKGKIINFTNDKCFIVDEKRGLAILPVRKIISMIPIRIIN